MVDYEIAGIIDEIGAAKRKLAEAKSLKSREQIEGAENAICLKTRTLFVRFLDIALWTGDKDATMQKVVRGTIESSVMAVEGRDTWAAKAIRKRLTQFDSFIETHRPKFHLAPQAAYSHVCSLEQTHRANKQRN